eukprot:m.9492 g.9492  ORF g.9492 m.9492 type:complete len:190 (+) comp4073_c0_seq1:52-621(+)
MASKSKSRVGSLMHQIANKHGEFPYLQKVQEKLNGFVQSASCHLSVKEIHPAGSFEKGTWTEESDIDYVFTCNGLPEKRTREFTQMLTNLKLDVQKYFGPKSYHGQTNHAIVVKIPIDSVSVSVDLIPVPQEKWDMEKEKYDKLSKNKETIYPLLCHQNRFVILKPNVRTLKHKAKYKYVKLFAFANIG